MSELRHSPGREPGAFLSQRVFIAPQSALSIHVLLRISLNIKP